ncbi:MAG: ABC transporter ATP-binding protein [Syntrophomonadaceae bacterium]|jgi:iron complex transport system ATP-binding protein|nr:ABC transporter ATP-binding protein [Syntrophomonadaceae bacterium]
MDLLECQDISFGYDRKAIIDRLSFTVKKGEIFCLLGPNGCGKTTLLDCVLGLHKIKGGQIKLGGQVLAVMKPREIARQIAYVPQAHEKTFPYTVLEIVLMGRASFVGITGSPGKEDRLAAEAALDLVGVRYLSQRPYTRLSGGESQLVMIARALAQNTKLLVMDEPTAHLDFRHELQVLEVMVKLVKEQGLAILMATHFPNHAFYFENQQVKSRVAMMEKGKFFALGTPGEVLSESNVQNLYNINARVLSYSEDGVEQLKQIVAINTVA